MPLKSGVSLVHLDEDVRTFVANTSTDPVPVQVVGAGGGAQDVNVVNEVEVKNDVDNPLSVSGSISVSNFPATQQVSGTVALDATTLAALETINVGNFPATQVVSDGGGSLTVDGSVSVNNHPASQSVVGAGAAATAQRVQLADESLAALENISATVSGTVSVGNTVAVSDGGGSLTVDGSVSATVTGTVALDTATLNALESITVQNGAGANAVNIQDGGNSITVDGTVSVGNFPASQTVNGTVTANLGTLNGAATAANQTTGNTSLSSLDNKTPDESGTWGYNAGVSGTLTVAANKRILAITATAGALVGATMTINGGQTITIPAGTTITISPRANLTAPTLVFTSTTSYFVEFIE